MNFFDSLIRSITQQDKLDTCTVGKSDLEQKVVNLNTILYNTDKDKLTLSSKIADMEKQLVSNTGTIESLKTQLAINTEVPTAKPNYIGNIGDSFFYYPAKLIPIKNQSVRITDPREMYTPSNKAKEWAIENRKLPSGKKKMKGWEKGIGDASYSSEGNSDNWQLQMETEARKEGDCECKATDQTSNDRVLGVPADETFLAVGPTSFGYHAWNIKWMWKSELADIDMLTNAGWYIFEATLDTMPKQPKPLIGSEYWINGGLQNWQHFGPIKPEYLANFNGVQPSGAVPGMSEDIKVENSEEKRIKLLKYWNQY
jgi:hypothetical protein